MNDPSLAGSDFTSSPVGGDVPRETPEYEISVLKKQIAELEDSLNQVRVLLDLKAIQLSKSAYKPHR